MGFDNDCILNISSLAGEYFCPVCHLLVYPNEALQAPCTHLYCKPCLTYVVSTTHACPYDGYRVTEADCKPLLESNKLLADTIGKIQVHCLYYRTGCTWQGPLSECTSHYSTCSYGESPVLCNRCGVQIVHRQVQEHAQNCPVQQSSTAQDSTSTGAVSAANQSQTVAQTGLPASQAQTSQASAAIVSGQDANQAANSGSQPQAAQATMPTAEQWYQQQQQYQQQYQQYYQQYPGYDPYQQNYQYYYQYQQGAQQYPQQAVQAQQYPQQAVQAQQYPQQAVQAQQYPQQAVQAYGQAQPQVSGQAQTQSQLQNQQQVQPHAQPQQSQQPQAPSQTPQPLPQTNVQPAANAQPQAQPVGQGQTQAQAQVPPSSHGLPYNQSQPLPQAQPYAQPQPQQQMQVPQYQQTHPQVQHPHPQTYPPSQTQTQHYPYPQPQSQPQPHSQSTMQAPARPPSQPNQPINPSAQPQSHNSVTGYQSYPQPHPQAQVGAAHPQPQYPAQAQGKFPSQPAQVYPSQPYSNVANQHPAMSSAQVQPPSGPPAQQMSVYPHAQQPGYPLQHRPGAPAPQLVGQHQPFPGQGPFNPPQSTMPGQLHAQGPPQTLQQPQPNYVPGYGAQPSIAQNYPARPVNAQPYAQGAGYAGTGQVRPPVQNQSYPNRPDNQLSAAAEQQPGHPQQLLRATGGEKPLDQMLDKSDQNDHRKEARDLAGASGASVKSNDINQRSENAVNVSVNGIESRVSGTGSKLSEQNAQEHKSSMKDVSEGRPEPSPGSIAAKNGADDHKDARKMAEIQDSKHTASSAASAAVPSSNFPQSHSGPQVPGSKSFPPVDQGRNQPQTMHYGPSGQHRPGSGPMPQPTHHPFNSHQPAVVHPPGQLRPQGPGAIPPRPPFYAAENSQPSNPQHLPGPIPHENVSGASMGPGPSGSFARPSNMGYHQGPPFAAQRHGEIDPNVGIEGKERADAEQRPIYPRESEKFQGQRPGYFDGRKPEALSHGMEKFPYGPAQPGAIRYGGPAAHDAVSGVRDERIKSFPEEHMKPFPHRDFDDDMRKFPRSSHTEAGPSSNFGNQFLPSGPLDHGPHKFGGDGMPRPFDKSQHGYDRNGSKMDPGAASGPSRFLPPFRPNDVGERGRPGGFPDDSMRREDFGHRPDFAGTAPGPGFGRSRTDGFPPRSPGRDFSGFPPNTFGAYGDGGNERPFEGSRPYNFPAEPFGKLAHENRFPVPPNHLQRGEHDIPGNMRMGEHFVGGPRNQDMLPSHLRRGEHMDSRNLHMGEATAFGPPGGFQRMGEPPLAGNFPQHPPFGESFGGEKPGHPLVGEPGFRNSSGFQRYARDGGFYPEDLDPFENPRMRKPGSIMCRICKVECGTVDGLDMHSQSREHQRKCRDMVLSIKQQNKKKQKISKGQGFVGGRDGGRPKNSNFQGRGNRR